MAKRPRRHSALGSSGKYPIGRRNAMDRSSARHGINWETAVSVPKARKRAAAKVRSTRRGFAAAFGIKPTRATATQKGFQYAARKDSAGMLRAKRRSAAQAAASRANGAKNRGR